MIQRVTTNDNEWQRVVQQMTTSSSTTLGNECPSDKEWYNECQQVVQ